MLKSLHATGYRGLAEAHVEDLTGINVFVGPNGCGKSSLLDVPLIAANVQPVRGFQASVDRRKPVPGIWKWLIAKNRASADLMVLGNAGKNKVQFLRDPNNTHVIRLQSTNRYGTFQNGSVSFNEVGSIQVSQVSGELHPRLVDCTFDIRLIDVLQKEFQPLAELFTQIVQQGLDNDLHQFVREFMPQVDDLRVLVEKGVAVLNFRFKNQKGAMAVEQGSSGESQFVRMACELTLAGEGLVLMEEPETHLHPRAMQISAQTAMYATSRGTQIMLTTHSLEYIDALVDAAEQYKSIDQLSVYRLSLNDGILKYSRFQGTDIKSAREAVSMDLR